MTEFDSILNSIDNNIKINRKNSIWNHFLTVIKGKAGGLNGQVTHDGFEIWEFNSWVGLFHPVIYGKLESVDGTDKIQIRSKMNPFGRLIAIILVGFWTYGIITGFIEQNDSSSANLWNRIFLGSIMIILPIIAFGLAFRYEYKKARNEIRTFANNG